MSMGAVGTARGSLSQGARFKDLNRDLRDRLILIAGFTVYDPT
jgi:hypothetical protein